MLINFLPASWYWSCVQNIFSRLYSSTTINILLLLTIKNKWISFIQNSFRQNTSVFRAEIMLFGQPIIRRTKWKFVSLSHKLVYASTRRFPIWDLNKLNKDSCEVDSSHLPIVIMNISIFQFSQNSCFWTLQRIWMYISLWWTTKLGIK